MPKNEKPKVIKVQFAVKRNITLKVDSNSTAYQFIRPTKTKAFTELADGDVLTFEVVNGIDWQSLDHPPIKFGWYAAAVKPRNWKELTPQHINSWRFQFGFTKVWFNPDSAAQWYEPDPHGYGNRPIEKDRLTHWAYLPPVPELL